MKKLLLSLCVLGLIFFNAQSQVAIGTDVVQDPDSNSILDLQSSDRGLLLPRVKLVSPDSPSPLSSHVEGMTVYNTQSSIVDSVAVNKGLYYNDGTRWISVPLSYTNWFYMPSIAFEVNEPLTAATKDLYTEYIKQFGGRSATFVKSTSAPAAIPYLPKATDLYYYITDYDKDVFSNITIDDNGLMTYDVTPSATDYSYINIVFVLK